MWAIKGSADRTQRGLSALQLAAALRDWRCRLWRTTIFSFRRRTGSFHGKIQLVLCQKKRTCSPSRRKASGQATLSVEDVFNAGHGIGPDGAYFTQDPRVPGCCTSPIAVS